MHMRRSIITAALLVTCAAPAWAQAVKIEFHNGRVTLDAQNVPLRTILNQWAQQGGTRIVNGDRIPGGLVTLSFTDVPERLALDAVLRNASGYIAGPRKPGESGASSYASILILPVSNAAAAPPPPQPVGQQPFPFARPIQRVVPQPDPDDDPVTDLQPADDDQGGPPRPGAPQRFFNRGGRAETAPQRPPVRNTTPNDDDDAPPPAPPSATPTTSNPFGVNVGSSQPGVISPAPQQPNAQQPRPRPNPEP